METGLEESKGMRLLKKSKKGFARLIFSRIGLMLLMMFIQAQLMFNIFGWFQHILPYFVGGTALFSIWMVLILLNSHMDPEAKITWLIIIMIVPVFGGLLYAFTQSDIGHRVLRDRTNQLMKLTKDVIVQDEASMEKLRREAPGIAAMTKYIQRSGCYPVYQGTDVTYFPSGESKWEEMLEQLKKAKHFIFLEYFIIDEGIMWGKVLEILAQKAKEGVDVRVMYDGTCEFSTLPSDYPKRLAKLGIRCKIFSPAMPFLSTHYNYRDHRKILVIDGQTAFNGGVNLADEYINQINRFGHWKDTAVMIKGEAVKSYTLMFLQMWGIDEKKLELERFLSVQVEEKPDASGYVLPYADSPLDGERVGERVYLDILNRAERYVHIMTPYLVLDSEMEHALKYAAERGVEVILILPKIPDKKAPYALAKTHYPSLLESGVKIYEYTPGFVHAKVFVADDREAVVGTINLDYRSLYHHFECATYLYRTDCIGAIEADFDQTLKACHEVTEETCKEEKWIWKVVGFVAKAVAPLI